MTSIGVRGVVPMVSDPTLRAIGRVICALCVVPFVAHLAVLGMQPPADPERLLYTLAGTLGLVLVPVVGALIVARQPRQSYGWVWLGLGAAAAVIETVAVVPALPARLRPPDWVLGLSVGWAFAAGLVSVTLMLLLFPDSRPPSPRWAWVVRAAFAAGGAVMVVAPFVPPTGGGSSAAPFAASGAPGAVVLAVLYGGTGLLFALVLGSTAAVPVRWRRAEPAERLQLKWFALGAFWFAPAFVVSAFLERLVPSWVDAVLIFSQFAVLQVAVGIAMLRYRLYDVDRVINRTLLYVTFTICLVAVYLGVVVLASVLLADRFHGVGQGLATAAVAVAALPLRARLQTAVNRLTFGRRGDPYEVLADLGHRLEGAGAPDAVLGGIVESVALTLRLPYVAIELTPGEEVAPGAVYGRPVAETVSFALSYQGEQVGRLLTSARSPREELTATDRRLLSDLAGHAGVAAHAVLLADDLRRSRGRVLATREEERRRLRRDLHDGLGPTLAAVALGLDSVRRRLDQPERAAATLARLSADLQGTIEEIRRLVHDLRPPALDQFGLIDAIRADARRFEREAAAGSEDLSIYVDAPATGPRLPAAVEVAAYRIAGEALTNVVRHSGARRCVVRLAFDDGLGLEVTDDGCGVPAQHRRGVGLSSMLERAAEVGGLCEVVTPDGGGTQVRARLPLEVPV